MNDHRAKLCADNTTDFFSLKAILFNTSLKYDAAQSHTDLLLDAVGEMMEKNKVAVERVHLRGHVVPAGVYPDMTEHGPPADG